MGHTNPGFTLRAYAHDARDRGRARPDGSLRGGAVMSTPSTRGVLTAVGPTDDIEADSEQEAVEKTIAAWRKLRPDRTFAPLLSAPALGSRDEAT